MVSVSFRGEAEESFLHFAEKMLRFAQRDNFSDS